MNELPSPAIDKGIAPPTYKTYLAPQATKEEADSGSCWSKQMKLVGSNKSVIDFGCAGGYFAKMLAKNNCQVTGVDLNPEAAKAAEQYCTRVVVLNLDNISIPEAFPNEKYDVAVFGDVLEHLRDPWQVLRDVHSILNPGGYVVASIPNIAHGAIRLSLLQGHFNYTKDGILDNTHLRFFTRESVKALFEESGYFLESVDRTQADIFENTTAFPQLNREEIDASTLAQVEADLDSTTVQFVVRGVPVSWQNRYAVEKQNADELREQLSQQHKALHEQLSQQHEALLSLQQTTAALRASLQQAESDLQGLKTVKDSMESSKFWKLRQKWIPFKEWILRR